MLFFVAYMMSFFIQHNAIYAYNAFWSDKALQKPYTDTFYDVVTKAKGNAPNIDLLISEPAYYYTKLNLDNPTGIYSSAMDWFTKDDINKAFHRLETTNNKVLIDSDVKKMLVACDDVTLEKILSSRFVETDMDRGAELYTPKVSQ